MADSRLYFYVLFIDIFIHLQHLKKRRGATRARLGDAGHMPAFR